MQGAQCWLPKGVGGKVFYAATAGLGPVYKSEVGFLEQGAGPESSIARWQLY